MKKITTTFVLTALLVTPTLPAWADGGAGPGLFGWFQSWLDGALSWVTGDAGPKIDPLGVTDEEGPTIDPVGLTGDEGPFIDPKGLAEDESSDEEGEGGPMINPIG